jgi:hypothetical protein
MSPSDKLQKLCKGVRAIGSGFEIHLKPSDEKPEEWAVLVVAGGAAILINTDFADLDNTLDQACSRLASVSQRTLAAVRPSKPPPPPDTEKE